jgi:subfamily B ATP-binding cassette protein MsbA
MTDETSPPPPERPRASAWTLLARLWRTWIAPRAGALALAIVLMLIVAGLTSSYAIVVAETFRALDGGGEPESVPGRLDLPVYLAPALILAITGLNALAWFAQLRVTQALALRVVFDMQQAMYARLIAADFARVAREPPGALAARFVNDVDRVREALMRAVTNLVRDVLIVAGAAGTMLYYDWVLALLVLAAYPLAFQPVLALGRRLRSTSAAAQAQVGELAAFLTESFGGDRLVKTYRLESYQRGRAERAFARRFGLNMVLARSRSAIEPILEFAGGIALAGIVGVAAWRIARGETAIPELLGFLTAVGVLAPRARALGTLNAVAQEGFAALERIFAVLDEKPKVVETSHAPELKVRAGRVTLEDVTFGYPDGARALEGVNLTLEPGTTTALVGPSGAGKSTVLNLIPRLYDPGSGVVRIDGTDIRTVSLASLRSKIALVAQDATLFDDTVRANVAHGRAGATDAQVWEALEAAAAREFVEALAGGLAAPVGVGGGKLSGGQRQRLALARAVLKDAPILLLDEATSALDSEAEAKVQAALERLSQGRTTLVIAHRLATVMRADKIYVLDAGRVVEEGADATLKGKQDGVYARLRELQFKAG